MHLLVHIEQLIDATLLPTGKLRSRMVLLLLLFTLFPAFAQKSISFQYTGRAQTWYVPSCVTRVRVEVWGAQGGNSMSCLNSGAVIQQDGGLGGYTSGELEVIDGQVLYIMVGGQGRLGVNGAQDGGFNGGGDGGMYAGGGGGATDIRRILNDLDSRLIVAGGGGGGNTGCPNTGTGGAGGGVTGQDGIALYDWTPGGGGGTSISGGLPGYLGQPGIWGYGGNAVPDSQFHYSGGGGGWYGGGSAYGAGGGGGSSMAGMMGYEDLENGITQAGVRPGNGFVVITLLEGAECVDCELLCNTKMNFSMPAFECYRVIRPEEVLRGTSDQCTTFGYGLSLTYPFGTSRLYGNDVDRSHLGHTIIYTVSDGTNSCWGYLTMEDKSPPFAGCGGTQSVSCYQLAKLLDVTGQVIDNCSSKNTAAIEKLIYTDFGCDNPLGIGRINRTIRATDSWGNSSVCSDTLYIQRDSLVQVQAPDPITLVCKLVCRAISTAENQSDFEEIIFSKNPADKYYPTPELLQRLQHQDIISGDDPCISADLHTVPYVFDSVLIWENGIYHKEWLPVDLYPFKSTFCKLTVSYSDKIVQVCQDGSGFKIRREWRITDWCTNEERVIIQNIEIADHHPPTLFMSNGGLDPRDDRLNYRTFVNVHSCLAEVQLKDLIVQDCSPTIKQSYSVSYTDISHPGKVIVQQGTLPGKILLPAVSGVYGVRCHTIDVSIVDGCLNRFDTVIVACVIDETPPEVVLHENTRVTVDPATCWSRIYAKDLDNGSRDNCCDVLHFAIATMDSINSARQYVYNAIIAQCGIKDYLDTKDYYDFYIEDYISSYIFKDYLDLAACQDYQIVVRVWEACGIPRYDPHIWPCSEHQWFLYNAGYPRSHYRADHNLNFGFSQNADYSKFTAPKDCNWRYPLVFCDPLLSEWFALAGLDDFSPAYIGSGAAELCNFDFYWPRLGLQGNSANGPSGNAPGNTCSRMLWKDGMVQVRVDDKTLPVAENPDDIFWYCDNVSSTQSDSYEYAICQDNTYDASNARDRTCVDINNQSYNEIECFKENDGDLTDAIDPTGKAFGWYGCNLYGHSHPDEHGNIVPCESGSGVWAPIYCHSWLCLDAFDHAGKINPENAFSKPVLHNGPLGTASAGQGKFWIWDNCSLDSTTLVVKNSTTIDQCGNGWLLRTWQVKDKCGNAVTVDQKIITKHRSDFEAIFPKDIYTTCGDELSLNPENSGKPILSDDECEVVGIVYTDERFDVVEDACYKILRTWRIIDWCKYQPNLASTSSDVIVDDRLVADTIQRPCVYRSIKDNGDGIMTYIQVIKIVDTIPPAFNCADTTICINDPNCVAPAINIQLQGSDNCSAQDKLSYYWEVDESPSISDLTNRTYNKNSIDRKSGGSVKSLNFVPSLNKSLVHIITHDGCGNSDTCTFIMTAVDCKKPTPKCYNGIATVIMATSGTVTVWASDLDAGSFDNCTSRSNLTFSFGPDKTQVKKDFSCADVPNGKSASITLDVYVWDQSGLFDFCKTYIVIQDGLSNICPDNSNGSKNQVKIGQLVSDPSLVINPKLPSGSIYSIHSPGDRQHIELLQNQPNPFNNYTWIQFTLKQPADYRLVISDLNGRLIWKNEGFGKAGLNQIKLLSTELKSTGVFYYTLESAGTLSTRKMIITF